VRTRKAVVTILAVLFLPAILGSQTKSLGSAEGIQKLLKDSGGAARVTVDPRTGVARFVRMPPGSLLTAPSLMRAPAQGRSLTFFREYGSIFGVTSADVELRAVRTVRDAYGKEQAIFRQVYKRLPVFGAELRAHFDPRGRLFAVNGTFVSGLKLDVTPTLSSDEAAQIAIDRVERGARENRGSGFSAVSNNLLVFRAGLIKGAPGRDHLSYEVEVRNDGVTVREFVYVDANNGEVVDQITGIHEAITRRIHEMNFGNVVWSEGNPFPTGNGDWNNEILGAGETYNLFASMTSGVYVSYDGLDHIMHTVNNDPNIDCPNANWNGTSTNYCTGVTGDDTVAHEWGHAYTDFTNGLIYQSQSGALNESYSDIWGEVVDFLNARGTDAPGGLRSTGGCSIFGEGSPSVDNSYRWLASEDDPAFGGAIRDMWNPTCYGDPGKVTDPQYFCGTGDSGGVHTNSGVPNHAFALMVDGGSYNGFTITGLGVTKAAHIHWEAQNMLTLFSNFSDQADALEAACSSLTGINLRALSTSVVNAGPSGEVITAANCTEVNEINQAVQFRTSTGCAATCPVLFTLGHHPEAENVERALHAFRDNILGSSFSGKLYTWFFYQHAAEVTRLLQNDPKLRDKALDLLLRFAPSVKAASSGRRPEVSVADLSDAAQLLDSLAARGSFSLKFAIWLIRPRLMNRAVVAGFGLDVVKAAGAR
jgi:Zn-dependent metalloprotease